MKNITAKQWRVLIGACLFQCAMVGVLINCSGVLFAQIRGEFGFTMSRVSLYNTIKGVATALAAASITAWYFRSQKAVFLFINQLITVGAFLLLILGADGPLWFVSAGLCGLSSCIMNVAVPMTLNQWFPDNPGTATGIAMAFSGISGAVCNPLCARLISSVGWHGAIYVLGGVMLALTIPGLLLMFHDKAPGPIIKPPAKASVRKGNSHIKWRTVVLVTVLLLGGSLGVTLAVNMSIFIQSLGYSLTVGAAMTTMVMMGNVGTKFLYGAMCDRIGVWRATQCCLLLEAAALLCYLFLPGCLWLLYIVSLLYGCTYALSVVGLSRAVVTAYGAESGRFLGIHTSLHSAIMAGASLLVGVIVDRFGGFRPVLALTLAVVICSFAAAELLKRLPGRMHFAGKNENHP